MTPELLQAAVRCPADLANIYAPHLAKACAHYRIDTPKRLAAFLAQLAHESGAFRRTREIWGPTPAQLRYEGRADLGNTQPGDGQRYCGRGLIQTTGRYNYRDLTRRLRARGIDCPDFEALPEALEQPYWAAMSAADYWDSRNLNELADRDDFAGITKKINGGFNGQDDRLRRWEIAKQALAENPKIPLQPKNSTTVVEEQPMIPLIAPFLTAAASAVVDSLPDLFASFKQTKPIADNPKLAATVVDVAKAALGAVNEQQVVEQIATPEGKAVVAAALRERWFEITEAGGGGIEGARRADLAMVEHDGPWWQIFRSPSFWALLLMLPLVYLLVLSIIGVIGAAYWSDDVRSAIAGTIVGSIIGGAVGYYWGQTTSRNRT